MTETNQTIEELKAEVAALKEQRVAELKAQAEQREKDAEKAKLERELAELKAGRLPIEPVAGQATVADNLDRAAKQFQAQGELADIKQARLRQGWCVAAHLILPLPPAVSIYYGSKTGNWVPTLAATGVACVALPLAIADFGFTFFVAPPVTSLALHCMASNEKRRKLGILMPEQADAMMAKVTNF